MRIKPKRSNPFRCAICHKVLSKGNYRLFVSTSPVFDNEIHVRVCISCSHDQHALNKLMKENDEILSDLDIHLV